MHRENIKIADLFLNLVISFKKLVSSTSKSDVELSMIREGFIVTSGLSLGKEELRVDSEILLGRSHSDEMQKIRSKSSCHGV